MKSIPANSSPKERKRKNPPMLKSMAPINAENAIAIIPQAIKGPRAPEYSLRLILSDVVRNEARAIKSSTIPTMTIGSDNTPDPITIKTIPTIAFNATARSV